MSSRSFSGDCDVVLIGAGPYGLSAAAYLKASGFGVQSSGEPMDFWAHVALWRLTRNGRLIVGTSKTDAGRGRSVPLNERARKALESWATNFPNRKPEHYIFPAEKYGLAGDEQVIHAHSTNPSKPIKSFKEAWEAAKERAEVRCRFHDLRHSACTRLVERGVPLPVIASLLGWSAGTTVRMARRYGHISAEAQRQAVAHLEAEPVANTDTSDQEQVQTSNAPQ